MTKWQIDRRKFLQVVGPAALGTAQAIGRARAEPSVGTQSYTPMFFTATEWAFIHAAVDRLIPEDEHGVGGVEAGVPVFLDKQMNLPYGYGAYFYMQGPFHPDAPPSLGYQLQYAPRDLYRLGIDAANKASMRAHQHVFADLSLDGKDAFLTALEKNQVALDGPPAGIFFSQLLTNVREGYFADPIYGGNRGMGAWKMIGFPGARADFTNWMTQQGRAYPYGPVSINGSRV